MSIHVTLLFEFSSLNGGEHSMLSVLQRLIQHSDWRFAALCPPSGPLSQALHELHVPITAFSVSDETGQRRSRSELLAELAQYVRQTRPDILHANSLSMSRLTGALATDAAGSQTRFTGHVRDMIRLSRGAICDLNANCGLVAVSDATREFHVAQGVLPERIETIFNGVEAAPVSIGHRQDIRQALCPSAPADATLLLNVGQICLRKSQRDAAKATVRLIEQGLDLHLLIAGTRYSVKQESRDYEESIRNVFRDAGHADRLHMLGYRNDIPIVMHAADLLVHTPRQEPFGRVLLEAAVNGIPIVCSNVGGTSEMLRAGTDALLFDPDQPGALENTIRLALSDAAATMCRVQEARQRIQTNFSVATAAERLATFWQSVEA